MQGAVGVGFSHVNKPDLYNWLFAGQGHVIISDHVNHKNTCRW